MVVSTAVVSVLQKTDGRDALLKLLQNVAGLQMWHCQSRSRERESQRAADWRGVMMSILDARALLWIGRWLVQLHKLHNTLRVQTGSLKNVLAVQLCCTAVYFFVDNIRVLMKLRVIPASVDLNLLRARNRLLQMVGYTAALTAEVLRGVENRPDFAYPATAKAALDLLNVGLPYVAPKCTYEPAVCGLLSAILSLRSMYNKSLPKRPALSVGTAVTTTHRLLVMRAVA
eukprot:TRINITY_DN72900_c0_g1_i1.p2 TRINITY_DN72900_c0_g1~~TRINITY_DN72900_c0_g1_i1.p2  ORF type:complete len:229 (+),score=44.18 TRINITY_DN72900_c0_g1_i1:118-804(+)